MRAFTVVQLCGLIVLGGSPVRAQTPPPIHGVTGTIATDATIKSEHKAANTILVKTEDGVEHAYRAVTGSAARGKHALGDLAPGTTVVVHYRSDRADVTTDRTSGLTTTEGIATKIDRSRQEIAVRYDDGRTETLKLTTAPADASDINPEMRIVAYTSRDTSQKVARYFTTVKAGS
jgi:hypothetical protein